MKPVKGMNLDVSPDTQPPGTYRSARNWIYHDELDSLMQEPGQGTLRTILGDDNFILAYHVFAEDNIVFLTVRRTAESTTNSRIIKWDGDSSSVLELEDNTLAFDRNRNYVVTGFINSEDERILIWTDNVKPPCIYNLDIANVTPGQRNLVPDRKQVSMEIDTTTGGTLARGTYFFSLAYTMPDGTELNFGPPHGPFRVPEDGGGIYLSLSNLDTDYSRARIGVIQVSDNAISAFTGQDLRFQTSTATTLISGRVLDELLLEEFTQIPSGYIKAETLALHENRLYLANLEEHQDDGEILQRHANRIEPLWYLERAAGSAETSRVSNDPNDARFMPDEVYAFYISWIREDGSYTRAYHIPGRKFPNTIDVTVHSEATKNDSLTGTTRTVDPRETHTNILANQNDAGQDNYDYALQYLNNDRYIFDSDDPQYDDVRYFHTRGTATAFNSTTGFHHGRMGLWENQNETYPAGFPVRTEYTWSDAGTVTGSATESIADDKVRHHRFPSLSWCFENVTNFDFDADEFHGFRARFEFITIPAGYTGAVIYHAKRNGSDNLIISHTPFHFGAANAYSIVGEGGSGYKDYSVPSPINAPQHSFMVGVSGQSPLDPLSEAELEDLAEAAGNPTKREGGAFSSSELYEGGDASTTSWSNWVNSEYQTRIKCHFNKATAYPHDLLGVRPNLPQDCYVRFEYMLIQEEEFPDDIQGHPLTTGDSTPYTMRIRDQDGQYYYATAEDEDRHTARRATFKMTQTQFMNRSFPQSEVKPMRNFRYIPAGAIDNEVKFDNRFGQECVYWDFDVTFPNTGIYQSSNHHNAGERWGYSIMNNPDGIAADEASGDTDLAAFRRTVGGTTYYQYHRNGYWLDTQWSTYAVLGVQRLMFVNITAMRFDCYLGYETQDLVACTPVLTQANTSTALTVGGLGEGGERRRVLQTVPHGDVYFSRRKYRVSSSSGFSTVRDTAENELFLMVALGAPANTNIVNVGLAAADPPDGTRSSTRGVISVLNEVPTISPVQSVLHDADNPQQSQNDYTWMKTPANPAETNKHPIIRDLLRINDWIQPIIHVHDDVIDSKHPHRVARSAAQREGDGALGVRRLPALDFIEQPTNRGPIRHLASWGDRILIHHDRSLFVTVGKETIATSAGEVVVGSGDIFRVKPTEVVPSEFGYGGTQHPQSCTMTPNGYFFADARNGKVFLYNGQLQEISQKGLNTYLQEALRVNDDFYAQRPDSKNAFAYHPGIHAEYDPKYHRVLMMVRKQDVSSSVNTLPLNLGNYHSSDDFTDETFFLSYSFVNNAWVSFHDMYVDGFLATHTNSYIWRSAANHGSRIAIMHDVSSTADVTYQMTSPSETLAPYIDIAFPANESVQWQSFNWVTKARQHKTSVAEYGHVDQNKTFAKAAVYNDYQCSGEVSFTRATDVDIVTTQRVTLRHNGTEWQFNGYRDLVADRTKRFIDDNHEFVTSNIDASKNWYDQRRFNSTHAVLRLIAPETTSNLLYLYDVDAKVRKAYR